MARKKEQAPKAEPGMVLVQWEPQKGSGNATTERSAGKYSWKPGDIVAVDREYWDEVSEALLTAPFETFTVVDGGDVPAQDPESKTGPTETSTPAE